MEEQSGGAERDCLRQTRRPLLINQHLKPTIKMSCRFPNISYHVEYWGVTRQKRPITQSKAPQSWDFKLHLMTEIRDSTFHCLTKIRFEIILPRKHITPDDKNSLLRFMYRNVADFCARYMTFRPMQF